MSAEFDPIAHFEAAYSSRQEHPLTLAGNPYKFEEARRAIARMLEATKAALQFEQNTPNGDPEDLLGDCCLARERNSWAREVLAERLPYVLGYMAVPGLEVMGDEKTSRVFKEAIEGCILPLSADGLELPDGKPVLEHLAEVLRFASNLSDHLFKVSGAGNV